MRHERTEERRKLFKIAEKRQNVTETPLTRWKKILPALPQAKAEILRNSETSQRDDVQITIGNLNDTVERKQLTTGTEQDSLSHNKNESKEEDDSNDTTSSKRYIFIIRLWHMRSILACM